MANAILWSDLGATTTYLAAPLDGLADGANKIGAEIDNTVGRSTYMLLELFLAVQGGARDDGANVGVYMLKSTDGVNFEFGGDALDPPSGSWATNFTLDDDTAARYVSVEVPIPPCKFKILLMNETGQAFAAANNTLKYRTYSLEVQ